MEGRRCQRKSRRGVGTIVGAAIVAGIMFTAIYTYFYVILQSEVTRGETDVAAQNALNFKREETFSAFAFNNTNHVALMVNNTGSIPVQLAYMSAYRTNSQPLVPPSGTLSTGLNPGGSTIITTPLNTNTTQWTFTVVTTRGNVAYAKWPSVLPVTLQNVTNIATNVTNTVLSHSVGSIEIDIQSLGYIQNRATGTHDGTVDQRGWLTNFTSLGGRGYPAFYLPGSNNAILTLKVRNLDSSGADLLLDSHTVLYTAPGGQNNNQSPAAYICYINEQTHTVSGYNQFGSNSITLRNVYYQITDPNAGWVNLYFCSTSPGGTNPWGPTAFATDITPVFLIIRGTFSPTTDNTYYSQTITFQAVSLTSSNFNACLKKTLADICSNSLNDDYTGIANTQVGNQPVVYCHISSTSPYNTTISWIDHNGKVTVLANLATVAVVQFNIPDAPAGYYIVQVQDKSGNVWPMTFKLS